MALPRDYEKETAEILVQFRAKISELNLINSEVAKAEHEVSTRKKVLDAMYQEYREQCAEFEKWQNEHLAPKRSDLNEIRSDLQALQATAINVMLEMMQR
jgi:hypothetical protein